MYTFQGQSSDGHKTVRLFRIVRANKSIPISDFLIGMRHIGQLELVEADIHFFRQFSHNV